MSATEKDTVYIDVDDEITSIIDKVQASKSKIVALVLPKRAVMLQSIVNMRLLHRAADHAKKRVVLITSEASLLPLAGAVGVYVAKNLQSRPEIPDEPEIADDDEVIEADDLEPETGESVDSNKSVGELAGTAAVEDTIEVDNEAPADDKPKPASTKGKQKTKIPNFNQFRNRLFIAAGGLVVLIMLWVLAAVVLPKATITIKTDTATLDNDLTFTANPEATAVDTAKKVLPVKAVTGQKQEVQKVPASGQKDLGTKASGTVTMFIACSDVNGTPPQIGAGAGVSSGGLTFITQQNVSLTTPDFSNGCKFKGSTPVAAQANGDQYNVAARSYDLAGGPAKVTVQGSAMSGGTTKMAKVVSQQDVDAAKAKFANPDDVMRGDLTGKLEDGDYMVLTETFRRKDDKVTVAPNVGEEATEVTVTSDITYLLLGTKEDELKKLIEANIKKAVEEQKQNIQDYQLSTARYTVTNPQPSGQAVINLKNQILLGPNIDVAALKQQVAGKKRGDTESMARALPGVKDASVDYSPFWVFKTPKSAKKITITLEKAN